MTYTQIENTIIERAKLNCSNVDKQSPAVILLTEGDDPRMVKAAQLITSASIGRVVLLFKDKIQTGLSDITSISVFKNELKEKFALDYLAARQGKGETLDQVIKLMNNPLFFGAMYLKHGLVDVSVSGAANTTADVFRAGAKCLGTASGIKTASSFFLMILPDGRALTYADCALLPYPNSEELADIAISAAMNHQKLTSEIPRVAMLSFSTKGSANHEKVNLVREAFEIVKKREPNLVIDAELQFDAAFVPEVHARKSPNSPIKGDANVFVFPNLDAGNIAYKITERIGKAKAIGPLLQGLAKPWMDLSRGCSVEDIIMTAAVATLLK